MRRILPLIWMLCAFPAHAQFHSAHRQTMLRSFGVTPAFQQVDTILDFHSQTPGTQYGFNPASDAWGNTAWDVYAGDGVTNKAMFTNCIGPDITYEFPVQTPDGHIATSSGTNWLQGDLGNNSGFMALRYSWFPGASRAEAMDYFCISNLSAGGQSSRDLSLHNDNPALIAQFNLWDNQLGGSKILSGIHSFFDTGHPSLISNLPGDTYISRELTGDLTNGFAFVTYRYAFSKALIFSSITYAEPRAELQGLYQAEEGYIYINPNSGLDVRSGIRLFYGDNVPTNRPPWNPNAPSGVTLAQYPGFGNLLLTYTDNCSMLNPHIADLNNGVSWTDNYLTNSPALASVVIRNLSVGTTYQTRLSALFPPNGRQTSKISSGTVTITNTDVTSGLQAQWNFNNDYSDFTGHGNTGTATGSPSFSFITNRLTGLALTLNGTSQYVTVPTSSSLSPTAGITITAWIREGNANANQHIVLKAATTTWSAPYWDYALRLTDLNHLQGGVNDATSGAAVINGTATINDDLWHLVSFSFDGTTENLYLDGALDATQSFSASINQSGFPVYLGTHQGAATGELFTGDIVDVRIFNRALTAAEQAQMFYNGPHLFPQ